MIWPVTSWPRVVGANWAEITQVPSGAIAVVEQVVLTGSICELLMARMDAGTSGAFAIVLDRLGKG